MKILTIDCNEIRDWDSFHDVFQKTFGFPGFYGRNMNAWIDCMSRLDEEFSEVKVEEGGVLTIQLQNCKSLKDRLPEIYDAIIECSAFVNWRRTDIGQNPILLISFYD